MEGINYLFLATICPTNNASVLSYNTNIQQNTPANEWEIIGGGCFEKRARNEDLTDMLTIR